MPSPSPYVYDTYIRIRPKVKMYAVRFLQERLIELKYLPANSVVDGDYGVGTRAAVKAFQQAAGLEISEYAEPEMQALLFSDSAPVNPNPVSSDPSVPQATPSAYEEDTTGES